VLLSTQGSLIHHGCSRKYVKGGKIRKCKNLLRVAIFRVGERAVVFDPFVDVMC
jgi:hypothetical protein